MFVSPRKLVLFMPNLNLTILIDKATLNVFNYIKKEKKHTPGLCMSEIINMHLDDDGDDVGGFQMKDEIILCIGWSTNYQDKKEPRARNDS